MLTCLSISILIIPSVSADDSIVDEIEITVPISCSMSSIVSSEHASEVNNGQTVSDIGTTNLKVICNDNSGFAIYAIGYTDDTYGKTVLTSPTVGSTHDIITSTTVTTGTSSWAMKLAAVSGTYTPIIAGSALDTLKEQGNPDFSDYTAVPEEYTKVAYKTSSTDTGTNATGSNLTTTYRAYISPSQPAGTYIGQVKYTLVHPNMTDDSNKPVTPLTSTDCPAGYVCYAPNSSDIDGSMATISSNTIASSPKAGKISVGQSASATATLIAPNYKRSGYGFAGWSTSFEATNSSIIYGPNETITVDLSNSGLILYPVWVESAGNLQGWDGCSSLTTAPTNTRATLSSVTALTDTRDGDVYAVARLADGKCWMIENLRLDDSATLTAVNTHNPLQDANNNVILKTDYSAGTTAAHLAASSGTWCTSNSAACDDQTMLNTNNTRLSDSSLTPSYSANNNAIWYNYGNYYNWYSATAGNGTYSFGTNNNSVTGDICPAGWHLPKGGNKNNIANSEFWALGVAIVGTEPANTSDQTYPCYTGTPEGTNASNAIRAYPNNFVYSGRWNGAQANSRSSGGYYWSSSAGYSGNTYYLFFSSGVYPGTYYYYKYLGGSVRCVAGS